MTGTTAEIFLGDQWLGGSAPLGQQLAEMIMLTIFYGSGALFVREAIRRTGSGWPTV